MIFSRTIVCPCCGTLLTVASDGVYTYEMPENPMANINNALFANQINQQNSTINNQIAQQNSIASNQISQQNTIATHHIAQYDPYHNMSHLINTIRQMEEDNDYQCGLSCHD